MSKKPSISDLRQAPEVPEGAIAYRGALAFQRPRKTWSDCPQPVGDVSLTQAEFQDDCDINVQVANYLRQGVPLPAYGQDVDMDHVQDVNATYLSAISTPLPTTREYSKSLVVYIIHLKIINKNYIRSHE